MLCLADPLNTEREYVWEISLAIAHNKSNFQFHHATGGQEEIKEKMEDGRRGRRCSSSSFSSKRIFSFLLLSFAFVRPSKSISFSPWPEKERGGREEAGMGNYLFISARWMKREGRSPEEQWMDFRRKKGKRFAKELSIFNS